MAKPEKIHKTTSIHEAARKFKEIQGKFDPPPFWELTSISNPMDKARVHAACHVCGIHGKTYYHHVNHHPESYVTVAYGLNSPDGGASNGFTAEIYVDHKGNFICSKCKYRRDMARLK